jgi:chromosome partitioning protein
MVDLDPQASLTIITGLAREEREEGKDITGFLDKENPVECCYKVSAPDAGELYLVPSSIILAEKERTLKKDKLKKPLEAISGYFDYCFIDCAPQMSELVINALYAANTVIVCCKTDYISYMGLKSFLASIKDIQESINPNLKLKGVVATMYEKVVNNQRDILDLMREDTELIGVIKKSADVNRTDHKGVPCVISAKTSEVGQAYYNIANII